MEYIDTQYVLSEAVLAPNRLGQFVIW